MKSDPLVGLHYKKYNMEKLKVTVGRNPKCDYPIENAGQHGTVSGTHATLSETSNPEVLLFEDHSRNGSYVNGEFVHNESREIRITDHITLGRTYVLPLEDIVRRYLSPSRTTQRKPVDQTVPSSRVTTRKPVNQIPIGQTPISDPCIPSVNNENTSSNNYINYQPSTVGNVPQEPMEDRIPDVSSDVPITTKPGIPVWFWFVIIGALVLGLIIGALL